jgi:hypothetical protein
MNYEKNTAQSPLEKRAVFCLDTVAAIEKIFSRVHEKESLSIFE